MSNTAIAPMTLRDYRKVAGHTQDSFGKLVGMSEPAICAIENGKRKPRPETAKLIADKLSELLKMTVGVWDLWPDDYRNPYVNQPVPAGGELGEWQPGVSVWHHDSIADAKGASDG